MSDSDTIQFLRKQSKKLRNQADELEEQAKRLEDIFYGGDALKGKAISDAAVEVFMEFNIDLDYNTLLSLVEKLTHKRVYGVDPRATLLAAIHRDDRIESCGRRSGVYKLKEVV